MSHPAFATQREELSGVPLGVEGALPDWLAGRYVQNGPGQFEVGGESLRHWFDPLAMLRAVEFGPDGPTYTNRFVRSDDFAYAREHGRVRTPFPGTPPDRSLPVRLYQALAGVTPDNPIIGVARVDGGLAAVTESATAIRIDPETLETTGRIDLTADLPAGLTLGHPHYDPERGALINLGVEYGRRTRYTLFRRDDDGRTETVATVGFDDAPYVHSFALTDRYAVLPAVPFGLDARRLLAGALTGDTFLDSLRRFDRDARFVVVERASGEVVARPRTDPFFVYHHANAYADGDELVVDLVAYPDERAVTGLTLADLRAGTADLPRGDLVRFRLPLDGGRARRETLREGHLEFPVVDYPRVAGSEHRSVYVAESDGGVLPTGLRRVDLGGGADATWHAGGDHPGEPMYVGGPGDDGVVFSLVLDGDGGASALVVLDGRTLGERARLPLPHRLPYGFHGQFYRPDDPVRSMP
ncbi:MAG: carotenoid oxygenase family protein [Halobacteriaceae archaeon]